MEMKRYMVKFEPKGVIPALVTPFTDDGKAVDENRLRTLVDFVIGLEVTGVMPCGSTGEFPNLTTEEKKKVLEVVIDQTNGRVPVIAGTGASGTQEAIDMTKFAKDAGADAALVVTPYYFHPASRGIYDHFYQIATTVDIPLIIYNIPQLTGVLLSWPIVEDLAYVDNIVGLKDSSGDLKYMLAVLEKVRHKIKVLVGYDEVVLPALASGANGMILASANFIPDIWLELYKAVQEQNLQKAQEIQMKIQKLARITAKSGAVGPKEALNMMGIKVGPPRRPLTVGGELTYEDREELRIELEKLGKIKPKIVTFEVEPEKPFEEKLKAIEITPEVIKDFNLKVGEALSGEDSEVAHVEVLVGRKDGPVGAAFTKAKSSPIPGHEPLLAILEPNLMVKPVTLIIPTVTIKSMRQASMIYGPAQQAVAKAVADTVADGFIPKAAVDDLVIIANVFVHTAAIDRQRVFINNYKATRHALRKAIENRPTTDEVLENKDRAKHPFKYTP